MGITHSFASQQPLPDGLRRDLADGSARSLRGSDGVRQVYGTSSRLRPRLGT